MKVSRRSLQTHQKHRRETWLQVYLPLLVGGLIMVGLGGWAVAATVGGSDLSAFGDTALIWLLLPVMVCLLIPLALIGGGIYLLLEALRLIPGAAWKTQQIALRVEQQVKSVADRAVEPFIWSRSAGAAVGKVKHMLLSRAASTEEDA